MRDAIEEVSPGAVFYLSPAIPVVARPQTIVALVSSAIPRRVWKGWPCSRCRTMPERVICPCDEGIDPVGPLHL
jgi:hypothetical protein